MILKKCSSTPATTRPRDRDNGGLRPWTRSTEDLVYVYILEAIENQKEGKEIKPEPKKLALPEELDQALKSDSSLKLAFQQLSRGKQIEYANHIGGKRNKTQLESNWLRKSIPLIMNGIAALMISIADHTHLILESSNEYSIVSPASSTS